MNKNLRTALFLTGMLLATTAQAGIIWFTDRAAWQAAVGAPSFTEDFSGFTSDQEFRTGPVDLNGMTIQQEVSGDFRNLIEVIPSEFTDNNGTNHASLFTNAGATYVRITFDVLNLAFGGESWRATGGENAGIQVYQDGLLLDTRALTGGNGDFLGYLLTDGDFATSVRFVSLRELDGAGGEGFGYDNLAGRGLTVSEPSTFALVGVGLLSIAATRRRGKRAGLEHMRTLSK